MNIAASVTLRRCHESDSSSSSAMTWSRRSSTGTAPRTGSGIVRLASSRSSGTSGRRRSRIAKYGRPQVGAAGEAAHEEQQVDGGCDILVRRIELVALSLDRSHQQPVDRVQVAIAVEQHEGGGHVRLQRGAGPGLGFQRLGDDLVAVAQAPRHVHADERRLGQPAAAVDVDRAELRRARQRGRRAHRVATTQHLPRRGLEHRGNPLVGLDARLGQMPRLPLRVV